MDAGVTAIITSLIAAIAAIVAPVVTSKITQKDIHSVKREARKHAAKQSIMQMIMQDEINVLQGRLPENYENVLTEFDEYKNSGGNSYVSSKVNDYMEWHKKIEQEGKWQKNGETFLDTKGCTKSAL